METRVLDGELFLKMVRSGAANLGANRQIVNDLNVFPVPDGDTGDNMFMTIDAGCTEGEKDLGKTAKAVASGMLLGARGNSGVILSKIFSGIASGLAGIERADVFAFGQALKKGVEASYGAVANPVNGTMLSVNRDAVTFANSNLSEDSTFQSYFEDFIKELNASLERTPDELAVLKEAGVVDSGGAGLIYIAEGMKQVLDGGEPSIASPGQSAAKKIDISTFDENSTLAFGYCTEFLLRLQNAKVPVERFDERVIVDYLMAVGESVVAFREGSILKVHVHTMHPGEILNECQKYGEFLTLKIENMMLQHNEATIKNSLEKKKPHKRYGIVSVASGEGMKKTFLELGVDCVIDGGQSMNPPVGDFIHAFEEINADTIFVFPNNSNILLTAKEAASLYEKTEIRILPSRTVGEGYAAISCLDTENESADEVEAEAIELMESVVTGLVAKANRNTEKDGVLVRSGDYIGYDGREKIYADEKTAEDAALALAEALGAKNFDVLLLISGKASDKQAADDLCKALTKSYPRTEVIKIDGGQTVEEYILVFE